jgi:hypothetical protein
MIVVENMGAIPKGILLLGTMIYADGVVKKNQ